MALQGFVDYIGPKISAAWLNGVDILKYTVFGDATSKALARTALFSDAPLEVTNGGTGSRLGATPYIGITSVETGLGLTIADTSKPVGNVLRYKTNAVPGTTDMWSAFQNAINVVALSGFGDVIAPRGLYKIGSDLWLSYDASGNSAFPSTSGMGGMVNIVGEGWQDLTNHTNSHDQGTILNIGSNQIKIGNGTQATRGVRFRNCTVKGNSTTYLIKYNTASRGCGFEDFTLFQDGIGGGIEMDNTFLVSCARAYLSSTNVATTGIGVYIHNSSSAAGAYDLHQVSAVAFAKNFVIGEEGTTGSALSNLNMSDCQGKDGQYNLILGSGVQAGLVSAFHNEGPTTIGVLAAWGARGLRFEGMYASNAGASAKYMSLGQNTGTDAADYYSRISVLNCSFVGIKTIGIAVYTSASVQDREIAFCTFTGDAGTETAIDIENDVQHGLTIGPNIYTTVLVEVSNPTRVDILRAGGTLGLITIQSPVTLVGLTTVSGAAVLSGGASSTHFVPTVITFANADATPSVAGGDIGITTGTTSITDFDDGVVGQTIKIRATANITITNNASIIKLAGAANFAMTADDTLTLTMYVDQVWTEDSRSVN